VRALAPASGADHRFDQGALLDFSLVLRAEHAELQHGLSVRCMPTSTVLFPNLLLMITV
jgi:hypothetical protein